MHIALQLIEEFFTFLPVIVLAAIGTAYNHDDKIIVIHIDLLVANRWFQQIPVILYPLVEVEWS
jgi:hypothetical protein